MVSEKVARRVEKVADQMGFRRSPLASALRTGRSYTIGVLIPDLGNPIFPPIVRGIERRLGEAGYIAILADSDNNLNNEKAILESMKSRHVDGLILATAHRNDPVVETCLKEHIPCVLVNRSVDRLKVSEVLSDDTRGIAQAVEHLVDLGHRRIAFVGGPQNTTTGRDRYRAFRKLWQSGKFLSGEKLIVNGSAFTEKEGRKALLAILKTRRKFTAVVAANDLLALGCYDALAERALRCPQHVSVTGFNDTPFMDRLSPPLTTVQIKLDEMGVGAAALLLDQIHHPDSPPTTIRLEPRLMVRGSSNVPAK